MTACPQCQTPNPPTARFCRSCGAPSVPAAGSMAAAPVSVPPPLPVVPAPELPPVELSAGAAFDSAYATEKIKRPAVEPVVPSLAPTISELPAIVPAVASPLVVEPAPDDDIPIQVWLNFSHVLIAGHSTTFEMRLGNAGTAPLEYVQVRMESRGLKDPITKSVRRIGPRQESHPVTLEIDPARPGRCVLRCTVRFRADGQDRSYVGERDIAINDEPASVQNLSVNIHDIMSNGGGGANANLGAEYGDVHIGDLFGRESMRSLNDLINLELPARFQPLKLALDYEISERLPAPQPSSALETTISVEIAVPLGGKPALRRLTIPAAFIGFSQQGRLLRLAPATPGATPVLLVARAEFRVGRSRPDVDFVTWFLPRSPQNDSKTKLLSRNHVLLGVQSGNVFAKVTRGANNLAPRATLDGQTITPSQPLAIGGRAALGLGDEYFLDVTSFAASELAGPPIANLAQWIGPISGGTVAPEPGGCVRLLPITCPESIWQSVWMFSEAAFGANRCNPVIIPNAGLEEIQGRFYYYRNGFWLEKSVAGGTVEVNGATLKINEIVPLVTGQSIQLGEIIYRAEVEK